MSAKADLAQQLTLQMQHSGERMAAIGNGVRELIVTSLYGAYQGAMAATKRFCSVLASLR